jgi:hypothetical protein
MNFKHTFVIAAIAFGGLTACFGGDNTTVVKGTTTISKGQELQDLQRALKEGAINQSEYDRLHQVILRRPN